MADWGDLPEASVAVLDADKEGFLRSPRLHVLKQQAFGAPGADNVVSMLGK